MKPAFKPAFPGAALIGLGIAVALGACGDGGGGSGGGTTLTAASSFAFQTATLDSGRFVRIDRMGDPAVGTALLSKSPTVTLLDAGGLPVNPANQFNTFNDQRDQFNRGDPASDVRDFATALMTGPQSNSLQNFHYETGPSLRQASLTPCSTEPAGGATNRTQVDITLCVAQVMPLTLPDVLSFDFAAPAGWPNGRHFDDPVIDRLLAAVLLNLSTPGQTINSLVGVINPWNGPPRVGCVSPCQFTGDDSGVISPAAFPFLRAAHP